MTAACLRLLESFRATMFSDATNSSLMVPTGRPQHLAAPGRASSWSFPAAITHEITLLRESGELLLVSALVRFVAPGQTGLPWW